MSREELEQEVIIASQAILRVHRRLSQTISERDALREIAQTVTEQYAIHDAHVGGVVCKWCGHWLVNDHESPEDEHEDDCFVLKVYTRLHLMSDTGGKE